MSTHAHEFEGDLSFVDEALVHDWEREIQFLSAFPCEGDVNVAVEVPPSRDTRRVAAGWSEVDE